MILNMVRKCKEPFIETINQLRGSSRRIALANISKAIGKSGQSTVSNDFHVSRDTIRKGLHELKTGIAIVDKFNARGRKPIEE
jgi:hypothetical protein